MMAVEDLVLTTSVFAAGSILATCDVLVDRLQSLGCFETTDQRRALRQDLALFLGLRSSDGHLAIQAFSIVSRLSCRIVVPL